MSVALYMDENVREAITDGLRERPDPEVLDRATFLARVAVSGDADFLAEAARRLRAGESFGGVIRAPQGLAIKTCVESLELIAKVNDLSDHADRVVYLPL